jgi:hypothetical protein
MKRLTSDISRTPPAVMLYRDDVEEILRLMGEETRILDDEFEYESLDDLIARRGKSPRKLYLSSSDHLMLRIQTFRMAGLHFAAWGGESSSAAFQILDLLSRRRLFLARLLRPVFWFGFAVAMLSIQTIQSARHVAVFAPDLLSAAWVIGFMLSIASQVVSGGTGSRIRLDLRYEASSFWGRNAEKLAAGAIGAVIGALAKSAVDWLTNRS